MAYRNFFLNIRRVTSHNVIAAFICVMLLCHLRLNAKGDPYVYHVIPKCGTHLIDKLLPAMTDKYRVQFGGDPKFILNIINQAKLNNKTVRLFCPYNHEAKNRLNNNGYKLIAMIRDPRDALVSMLFYMRKQAGLSPFRDFFRVDDNFDRLSIDKQLFSLMTPKKNGMSYLHYYKTRAYWALQAEYLTVKYEELVGSNGGGSDKLQLMTLIDIKDYLNLDISSEKIHEIAADIYKRYGKPITVEDKTFIPGQIGNWKTVLTADHKKLFKKILGQLLIDLGYEKDLNW